MRRPRRSERTPPAAGAERPAPVDERGYRHLAALRAGLRQYLAWAEQQATEYGMTAAQVQLALAVRAHPDPKGPTLSDLAQALLLRHHSVVGLVDRAERAGFVVRARDEVHLSRVHVQLTDDGSDRLATLSGLHLQWLAEHGAQIGELWASSASAPGG